MKVRLFLAGVMVAATVVSGSVHAQSAQASGDCRCEDSFGWLRSTFETNDAGFGYAVEKKGRAAYDLHNQITLEKVRTARTYSECGELLYEWLTFFRRGHIGIQRLIRDTSVLQTPEMEMWEGDIAGFEKEIDSRQDAGLEGIWEFGPSKIGFKAEGGGYIGFFIESDVEGWDPGMVAMRIVRDGYQWQIISYNYTGGVTKPTVISGKPELVGNTYMLLQGRQLVKRLSPVFPEEPELESFMKSLQARTPYIEELNPAMLYMRIPSFDHQHKPAVDKMIADNRDKLFSVENLIIDVRGNGGGSDITYEEILPFLYTDPVRTPAVSFLSTPLNIEKTLALLDIAELGEELHREIAGLADKMKAHPGELVPMGDKEVEIEIRDTVYQSPRNVAIIVDERCGSTTEQFLLAAKQSKKVKLFGTTTYGSLDASNVRTVDSPDGRYRLLYTTSLSSRVPGMAIDEIGLQPDFYLDETVPRYRWVEHVSEILNR